ncbi:MAG: S9 family peptidase [Proteobacteria bacterium]|uniref:prolyl oligopeptidase family serine peptidase n=1 Tax=Rudaea sp. TaxID=2136325 RepID=UPI001DD61F83|nr:S9 family peptidase [Pseudomonadota bacterium]MBS0565787.1 S9 family peptidase [Pseudomonadota bacterium]
MIRRPFTVFIASLVFVSSLAQADGAAVAVPSPTLETIMADPAWIGSPPQNPFWSVDGKAVYYSARRKDSALVDLHRVDLADGKDSVVDGAAMAASDGTDAVYDLAGTRAAFARNGDIFVRDLRNGALTQVTRTPERESAPQFSADGRRLSFRAGNDWFVHDLASHVTAPAAVLKSEKDPDAKPADDDLRDFQLRTFSTLARLKDEKEARRTHAEELRRADPTRAAAPFFLGEEVKVLDTELSPDARFLLVVTMAKKHDEGRHGELTRYVTESGYEEFEKERVRVGRNAPAPQSLQLLDLVAHKAYPLALDALPGIHDDPLKSVREENARQDQAKAAGKSAAEKSDARTKDKADAAKPRGVRIVSSAEDGGGGGIAWSRDGQALAIQLRAIDNKDRWIATVDLAAHRLVPQHRLTDPAWINWNFNEFGFLDDNRTLWYESEETGYAHLYTKAANGKASALTGGRFEVSRPQLSTDGRWFYLRANAEAPYAYDVYRVPASGGKLERVTHYKGMQDFALSHDGRQLLVTHSASYVPAQLAIVEADGSGSPRELGDTRSAAFAGMTWLAPEIVEVPSTHFKGVIFAKLYKPAGTDKSAKHPAVIFVHGAGYLQNVHLQYPAYFREQMFHNLLVQKGYVVIDMDYRGSEGYGREWRTAIYRQMGHPELEDLLDGKKYLVDHYNVDPKRVGIYGGSYGGFMTLMALFRAPGEFAAGAALRPVTDWMQYNHEYTSNILNTPQDDPIAYKRSSPIEFAAGLRDPLLICHGVIDDNVLFEDSMRLYWRLIELHKDNFTISPYPLDRHGFTNADAWLDEYKRIDKLFETNLESAH